MEKNFGFIKLKGELIMNYYLGDDTHVTVPETYLGEPVTEIGQGAFYKDNNIKEIYIPKNIKKINYLAFFGCNNLTKIIAENTEVVIENKSFYDCKMIKEVSFDLIEKFDEDIQIRVINNLIDNWGNITNEQKFKLISIINNNYKIKDKLLLIKDIKIFTTLINEVIKIDLQDVSDYLEYHIKEENISITSLLLEFKNKSFTKQEIDKFNERKELLEVGLELPTLNELKKQWKIKKIDNVISIEGYIGNSKEQIIPIGTADGSKITRLKLNDDSNFNKLEILIIKAQINKIEENCFKKCKNLRKIILPDSITVIGKSAFEECNNLEEIELPNNLTSISEMMFYKCSALNQINLPENLKRINNNAFSNCVSLKEICIPSIYYLGEKAFSNCYKLSKVIIKSGLNKINKSTFEQCCNLIDVILPISLEEIGEETFIECINLEEITIPKNVEVLSNKCFKSCFKLIKVNFLGDKTKFKDDTFKDTPIESNYK